MNKNIIELENEQITEEYENIKALNLFLDSQERGIPIKMTVDGCQSNENATTPGLRWMAVGYVFGWKVLIPASMMGFSAIDDDKEMDKVHREAAYKSYIKQMIGAEIEFIVLNNPNAISQALRTIIGNRKACLEKKMESNYFKKDKANGKSKIERAFESGKPIQARVVTVAKSVVWVEIFGYVTKVFAKEVSYRFVNRLENVINVGDIVLVKFLDLKVDKENKTIESYVSIKAAYPNIMKENMKKYQQGSIMRGVITGAKDGYFVQIGDVKSGIDVYCKKINCPGEPKIGDTVLVNLYIFDYEAGRVYGSIEKVLEQRDKWAIA